MWRCHKLSRGILIMFFHFLNIEYICKTLKKHTKVAVLLSLCVQFHKHVTAHAHHYIHYNDHLFRQHVCIIYVYVLLKDLSGVLRSKHIGEEINGGISFFI